MPGQTPIYQLPYPTQTDPVWQGATAIENLARRLEAVLSAAGVAAAGGSGAVKLTALDLEATDDEGTTK